MGVVVLIDYRGENFLRIFVCVQAIFEIDVNSRRTF